MVGRNHETLPLITKADPDGKRRKRAPRIWPAALIGILYYLVFYRLLPFLCDALRHHSHSAAIGTVRWSPCTYPDSLPNTECGSIVVPKDYFNLSAGTAGIALGKLKADPGQRLGTVLFNPGGPGGKSKPFIVKHGNHIQAEIGSSYDIIGFDPRGVGDTLPVVRCFDDQFTYAEFKRNTVLERSYDFASNQSHAEIRELLITQEREADALLKAQFSRCSKKMGDDLKYMGTTTVVRDMDLITRTLEGEEALINYYGVSYGSILGQYLVNMVPDRVGRVGIDAIADATLWAGKPPYQWYSQWLSQSEKAYDIFLTECYKAGPQACALVKDTDQAPANIDARLEAFHDSLYYSPVAVPDALQPGILTAGRSRMYVTVALEMPGLWPQVAQQFHEAISGNATSLLNGIQWWNNLIYTDLERSAITCNDLKPFAPPSIEEVVDGYLDVYYNVSRSVFGVVTSEPDAGCQYWPVTPPERFEGPWNHTLKTPMLIITSAADPVTPAGKRVDEIMGSSSRLLVHDSPGHGGFALPSLCLSNYTRAYFEEGILPPEGTICPLEDPLFPAPAHAHTHVSSENETRLQRMRSWRLILERYRRGLDV